MIKILIIALVVYLMANYVRADLRRRFAQPRRQPRRVDAVETIKCPRCGTFVAEGVEHVCQPV